MSEGGLMPEERLSQAQAYFLVHFMQGGRASADAVRVEMLGRTAEALRKKGVIEIVTEDGLEFYQLTERGRKWMDT